MDSMNVGFELDEQGPLTGFPLGRLDGRRGTRRHGHDSLNVGVGGLTMEIWTHE